MITKNPMQLKAYIKKMAAEKKQGDRWMDERYSWRKSFFYEVT